MKLKNNEINVIYNTLMSIGDKQSDIGLRFDLVKKIEPLRKQVDLIKESTDKLIAVKHEEDENVTSISVYDTGYMDLMNYENEFDFDGLTLGYLAKFNPSTLQLSAIEKIIK